MVPLEGLLAGDADMIMLSRNQQPSPLQRRRVHFALSRQISTDSTNK